MFKEFLAHGQLRQSLRSWWWFINKILIIMNDYKKNSLTLTGAVSMGTGVMIGAGIFALLGQVAELSGKLFPVAFVVGAVISAFSAYSYIKLSNAFPSAGGIGMYLKKEYGKSTFTAFAALLMAFSMVTIKFHSR